MTQTATKRRNSPTRRARGAAATAGKTSTRAKKAPAAGKAAGAAKKAGGSVRQAVKAATPSRPRPMSRLGRAAALQALKFIGRKALDAGAEAARSAADRTAVAGRGIVEAGLSRRLPIQVSIDVAVPLAIAWEEWMTFRSFTEGIHRIEDVERDDNHLLGRTSGPRSSDWEAEILDERHQQAFAWRSVEGSDCAGLVTFHRLSERLTRIELDLDVLPTGPVETIVLSLHVANRRAETELRRFKATVEFINPDAYEAQISQNGSGPEDTESDSP